MTPPQKLVRISVADARRAAGDDGAEGLPDGKELSSGGAATCSSKSPMPSKGLSLRTVPSSRRRRRDVGSAGLQC